jgi:lipopolysaccharide transport system ATP-binding protein
MRNVIEINNLSKIYRLGEIGTGTISRDLDRWFKMRIMGREDPYLMIGETNIRSKKGGSDVVYSLKGIDLEIKEGESIGIIGKNGAGKSTLLKIISRVTSPTLGRIKIKGRVASLLEVGTGFHPELTGRENIYLNGAILGMRKGEITRKLDEIIDFSGVERYIDTPVKRYSSGMYVRLAFAVSAHLESEIMVVDEVLAVGDAEFQKKCLGKMGDVSKGEGRTILFVSHNMPAIQRLCSVGLVLKDGSIFHKGTADSAIRAYLSENNYDKLSVEKYFNIKPESDFQLVYAKVCDENYNLKSVFECDDDVLLLLKFKIQKKIPGLYGYLQITRTDTETAVLVSDSNDIVMNFFDGSPLGDSEVVIRIPKRTLGVGVYSVYLNFSSDFNISSFHVASPAYILSFSLNDSLTTRGNKRG